MLAEMLHSGDKINFAKFLWEKQENGSWNKTVYTRLWCPVTNEYTNWKKNRILKSEVPEKEYFKRKLSGKT